MEFAAKEVKEMRRQMKFEFSDKSVSPWGGLRLVSELFERTNMRGMFSGLPLPQPGSNRGYATETILESFMVGAYVGAERLSHVELLRHDEPVKKIFGWRQTPTASTLSRFFAKCDDASVTALRKDLPKRFFQQVNMQTSTLDIDSTVLTRYGDQEGARRGYNPTKPGRSSHHPLIAFVAEQRMVAHAVLRPGNVHTAKGCEAFLQETLEIVGSDRIGMVRADSGFYSGSFIEEIEKQKLDFIVAAKGYKPIRQQIAGIRVWRSTKTAKGVSVGEFTYQPMNFKKPYRFVVVRQSIEERPHASGRLFTDEQLGDAYRYAIFVTSLRQSPEAVWGLYRMRADAENRIKELKHDFAIKGFALQKFNASHAAFQMLCFSYNMMSLLQHVLFNSATHVAMRRITLECIAIGSWIVHSGRHTILKLALPEKRRTAFMKLFDDLVDIRPPIQLPIA